MKILVVGDFNAGSFSWVFKKNLEELGHEVKTFDYIKGIPLSATKISPLKKAQVFINIVEMNQRLLKEGNGDFEGVIYLKAPWIFPSTVKKLKSKTNSKSFQWNPDDPFYKKNTTKWHLKSLPHYDAYFVWDKRIIPLLEKKGAKQVDLLPFCADPSFKPEKVIIKDLEKFCSDIGFVANESAERANVLKKLIDFNLKIFGGERWNQHEVLRQSYKGGPYYYKDMAKIIMCTKINLNILHHSYFNKTSHNMRTFEIPMYGGFQLAPRTEFYEEVFKEDKEVVLWDSINDLRSKMQYYLDEEKEREKIAEKSHKMVIKNHTVRDRVKKILSYI